MEQLVGDVTIRELRPTDVESTVAACDWLFAPPASVPGNWDPAAAAARLERLCEDSRSIGYVAEREGEFVGFATVYLDLDTLRFGQRAWLNDLAVDPDVRSRGIGRLLLRAALDWAGEHGATQLLLDSSTVRVDAHRFYRREQPDVEATCFGWRL